MTINKGNKSETNPRLGPQGFCSEDPRYCPMTKHQNEENPGFAKNEDLTPTFLQMHLDDHDIINPAGGHGYCQICNERYCCNDDRQCFSEKLRYDALK